jgi:pyrroloquinoline-quinone synthase
MNTQEFLASLDARIAKHDLLCHPFYKAWSAGELTTIDLKEYAEDYYHHVKAFPTYLAELAVRLNRGELREAILANMADEKGLPDATGQASVEHAELWLDFAEAMGSSRQIGHYRPVPEVESLINFFHDVASAGTAEEALAAFYAYESQVPRVAREKARGLREIYGSDDRACSYFTLHTTADVFHSQVWRQQLAKRLESTPEAADRALAAGEAAAKALWTALDGIEARRTALAA